MFALLFPQMCGACRAYVQRPGLCEPCAGAIFNLPLGCEVCLESLDAAGACPNCACRPPEFERLISPWEYEGVVTEILLKAKSSGDVADLRSLVREFERTSALQEARLLNWPVAVLPSEPKKIRARGHELTSTVARWAGLKPRWPLKKIRPTLDQKGLDREEREQNVRGAFSSEKLEGPWILFDDVVTTGATMSAAARVMKEAGASQVIGLSLARTINIK